MKKIREYLKKLNNAGSSIIMVIVSLAFIGIVVGALLSAAGYAYKLKLEDLNARDNFYYVEQAINEIYAGVGSQTVDDMKDAYTYTVENMVYYDLGTQGYVTKSNDEANKMFKEKFMELLEKDDFFDVENLKDDTKNILEKFISNETVELDKTKLAVYKEYKDDGTLKSVVLKNVTLTRTAAYDHNAANGNYTQTITTDIVIGEPDFTVAFNGIGADYANIFNYAMVADMGVEVSQPASVPLVIAGNIYAAADYYNKDYNESTFGTGVADADKEFKKTYTVENSSDEVEFDFIHGSVTSKTYSGTDEDGNALTTPISTYYNENATLTNNTTVAGQNDYYDGVNQKSMYSGFYVDGSNVSILADTVIVPGSLSIMNKGTFSLFGKSGKNVSQAELWTDNIVLGGYNTTTKTTNAVTGAVTETPNGSTAIIRANAYVKDDTEINAAGASLQLIGDYYGYGDSTAKDTRTFMPTVDKNNFQIEAANQDGTITEQNRFHYNSSAIIVNGEKSTLDLSKTKLLYLAGRSYIELSKQITEGTASVDVTDAEGETAAQDVKTETYAFVQKTDDLNSANPDDTVFLRDYKTGESISLKSNQQAYIPVMYTGMPVAATDTAGKFEGYWNASLHTALRGSDLFEKYFPAAIFNNNIPCVMQEVSGKKYYYYDFETAYERITAYYTLNNIAELNKFKANYELAQDFAAAFIVDYVAELNNADSTIANFLTDIGDYEDFTAGDIKLPDYKSGLGASIYSSGAITSKSDTAFNMVTVNDASVINNLLSSDKTSASAAVAAANLSNDLEDEYNYYKWNLGKIESTSLETKYVDDLIEDENFGESAITPINKFLNFNKISKVLDGTVIKPKLSSSVSGDSVLDLASGYYVWVNSDTVTVKAKDEDNGVVRGIVITRGDVYFDTNVTKFEGLIVAGGKIYITNNLREINASAEVCKAILRECQLAGDENSKLVLSLFKGYEDTVVNTDPDASEGTRTIDTIDYTDVCSFDNWMKNVE